MPEVLISGFLLMMFVVNTGQLTGTAGSIISKASLRESGNSLIAEDLNALRREAIRWACLPDTACSGNPDVYNIPAKYRTEISKELAYQSHCANQTTAAAMVNESDLSGKGGFLRHDPGTNDSIADGKIITWTLTNNTSTASINASRKLNIVRTIKVSEHDSNRVQILYKTSSISPISLQMEAVLIPTALSRCI